ncbi:MAG TPA: hypothetical protein VMX97_13060 [Hyphomicrobiaceae bacterium]|nr:hypothetical protein [Hyphomicrobiaceae bacterium]
MKIPAKELGFWSAPVVITYVKSTAPTTTFEFPEVYRKATFYLDKFVVVEDQSGAGREEFHIGGFIQELFQTADQGGKFDKPGRQIEIGPYYQEMNPPKSIGFTVGVYDPTPKHWNFNLSNKKDEWPRRFLVGFSVLEEDDGSGLAAWNKSLKTVKIEIKKGQVLKMTQEQIENFLKGKLVEGSGWVVAAAELIAGAAAPAGAIAGPAVLVATGVALVGIAIGAIIADMDDDDYGTNGALLTLPSNRVDDIRALPGKLVGAGQYEKYEMSQQKLEFAGPALAGAAVACCDGKVEIRFHWEFSQRETE